MQGIEEKMSLLPFWMALSDDERALTLAHTSIRHFDKGDALRGPDNAHLGMILVLSGRIQAAMISENGRKLVLRHFQPGESCAMTAGKLLNKFSYDVWMEAETPLELLVVASDRFEALMASNDHVALATYKLMTERFSEVLWTIQSILFQRLDNRLATQLLARSRDANRDTITCSHEELADAISSAREAVTRMLKRFEEEGLIHHTRSSITLIDKRALEKI